MCLTSPFVILGVSGLFYRFYFIFDEKLVNTVNPDQTPHYVASDLGLHYFPDDLFTGFQVKWVNILVCIFFQGW